MRKPNHIVLDFEHNNISDKNYYWAANLLQNQKTPLFFDYVNVSRKYDSENNFNTSKTFIGLVKSNTLKSNNLHKATLLKDWEKKGFINLYKSTKSFYNHDVFDYLNLTSKDYTNKKINLLVQKYTKTDNSVSKLNNYIDNVNINFLRKERLYTKLKYSRSPAYDIVSGGAAALLAGFIGFLISEKFGYELVDSGDFYYAFMYCVFAVFSIKPLLTVSDSNKGFLNCVSLRPLFVFISTILKLIFKKFK